MSSLMESVNKGALELRDVYQKYKNLPKETTSPFSLSKSAPYFGFVDVQIGDCRPFVMFSNNDDFVANNYFWNGANAYEPMSLKCWQALAKSSSVIFDVGSYSGVYSIAAASQNSKSKVFSFEALDTVYSRLLINKIANMLGNLEVHHLAVSDVEGFVEFNVYAGDSVLSTGSSILSKQTGRTVYQKKQVQSISLDALMSKLNVSRLDLMKIDAEGAEHLIFKGGRETLKKHMPDIVCEFLKGAETEGIESMLSGMGYRFFQIDEKAMSIVSVDKIVIGENMDMLNTLITRKPLEQLQRLIEVKE
jgi:FkbM family methyltransferase